MSNDERRPRRSGLARTAVGAGCVVLLCLGLAVAVLIYVFVSLHHNTQRRHERSTASVVSAAERVRLRLANGNADGTLTDAEIAVALDHRTPRTLTRGKGRTELVTPIAAGDQSRCYEFTALATGAVTSRALDGCPTPTPPPRTPPATPSATAPATPSANPSATG